MTVDEEVKNKRVDEPFIMLQKLQAVRELFLHRVYFIFITQYHLIAGTPYSCDTLPTVGGGLAP